MKKFFRNKTDKTWYILLVIAVILNLSSAYINTKNWFDLKQVTLISVEAMQTELVSRGYDIKIDGKFGPNTDLALTMELSK